MTNLTLKEALDRLKEIRMELIRSSSQLDVTISQIEDELFGRTEIDQAAESYIRALREYRATAVKCHGWNELTEFEEDVWQQLLNAKEES